MSRPAPADFYRPETFLANESVAYLIKCVTVSLAGESDRRLVPCELTSSQCGVLMQIQREGKATMSKLARALATNTGAATRLVDRLERKKLVARTRAPTDRRVVYVELTAEGEARVPEASAAMAEALNAHLASFSSLDVRALESHLKRMLSNGETMQRDSFGAPPRFRSWPATSKEYLPG